jgi:hypothetical protein
VTVLPHAESSVALIGYVEPCVMEAAFDVALRANGKPFIMSEYPLLTFAPVGFGKRRVLSGKAAVGIVAVCVDRDVGSVGKPEAQTVSGSWSIDPVLIEEVRME